MNIRNLGILLIIIFLAFSLSAGSSPVEKGENCTNFAASYNGKVLFGNSEDASANHPLHGDPDETIIWFLPASEKNYGMMQLGWYFEETRISYQGGMNEFGLCYDSTAIPEVELTDHPEKPFNPGNSYKWRDILGKCRNIDEAVDYINQYNFKTMWFQIFLTDATGESVIVSPNESGELTFTYKGTDNGYIAQTNFNRINPNSHFGSYPCDRYETCSSLLSEINDESKMSVEYFKTVLDAVHQNDSGSYTPYSNIFNPETKTAYIYYASQFDEPVEFDLMYELSLGLHEYKLSELVSDETHDSGLEYHQQYLRRSNLTKILIIAGVGLTVSGLIALLYFLIRRKRKR